MELKKKEKSVVNYPTLSTGIIIGAGLILTACSGSNQKSENSADKKIVEESKDSKSVIKSELDTDGDGIPDKVDKCPTVKGTARYHGCSPQEKVKLSGVIRQPDTGMPPPVTIKDTDGDGIADKDDKCPTSKGTAEHNGCPPPIRRLGQQVPVKE